MTTAQPVPKEDRAGVKEDQMSATVSRTGQATLEMRQLLVALFALIVAVALVVAVAVSRQPSAGATIAATGAQPVVHDHGWSSTTTGQLRSGGLIYTGIPYPAPDQGQGGTGGANGTRFAR
ncbi:MAG TPA: hypothetical protein VFY23_07225 [Candidatus Limnocylindrales bacterium]|nr:hypothetical protein [Candidatus Limnocylindrales bacterium]